ncbi:MAG: methyltransferase domain-containing protein [Lachnospiraceae bacterium]|nr:methyltransferase domain-containing protein [Lachnospiraceae bacterium]
MTAKDPTILTIVDRQSLIHVGSLDSFDITEGGKKAAGLILEYLDKPDADLLKEAINIYEDIIPNENFGGEYTALEWMCRYFLMDEDKKQDIEGVPAVRGFKDMMVRNDYDNLKTYLQYKYHIVEYGEGDNTELKARMRFLEDYILFNNPDRERWETTRENIERLALKPGMEVADVGCGPGYYSFKFSDIVGEKGRVYAIETNPRHLEYLEEYVAENDIRNVAVTKSTFEGIGLSPDIKVDIVYICSLYHNVYAAFTDAERDSFVGSIRHALRDKGRLIIVDNDLVTEGELPYHGPYVNKDMIVSQLHYYGFRLVDSFQFTPQRYGLIFDMCEEADSVDRPLADRKAHTINVNSAGSLIRYRIIGTATSGYTVRGKRIGRVMHEGLMENDREKLQKAYDGFSNLYPLERVGDDYTALMWFISYYLADDEKKSEMTKDLLTKFYSDFFCGNDYDRLKTYLLYKFHLELHNDDDTNEATNYDYTGKDFPIPTINEWNEFLIFNNPNRYMWEKTDEFLAAADVKPGETVADIGCGGGFFTWKFAKAVGENGLVYATEINEDALHYVQDFRSEYGISQIKTIEAKMNDATLPDDSLDMIFMCSMYHAVYITDIEFVKDDFIASLKKALKKDGRLVIVDNNITDRDVPSYYGPGISPELVIAQLGYYGFKLVDERYPIPQRFVLVFKKDDDLT